jgi:hypothetical protein
MIFNSFLNPTKKGTASYDVEIEELPQKSERMAFS